MAAIDLDIPTAAVNRPLLARARYKGASGGRSSGKSHFYAEAAVQEMVEDPALRFVCIREVQRSLKFSAKSLVERKIRQMGVTRLFEVLTSEIRRVGGTGVMIFEGMQDHTADSLKSLEGFGRAWVEEAQNLSQRSLDLLLPTIRAPGSEIWFSWNPEQPEDPVDAFFGGGDDGKLPEGAVHVHSTYLDNPFNPPEVIAEAERLRSVDPDGYAHIWLGRYNLRSDAQVLAGKVKVFEFEPEAWWDGPYFGADWGFANDPTVLVRCWIADERLYIEYDERGVRWDMDEIGRRFARVPDAKRFVIRGDSARPETIHELNARGYRVESVKKWAGSVEEGVEHLRSYTDIVIHPRCTALIDEARLWRYKTDPRTGDVLPKLVDAHNHGWDAVRYALQPMIRHKTLRVDFGALGDTSMASRHVIGGTVGADEGAWQPGQSNPTGPTIQFDDDGAWAPGSKVA